MDMDKDRSGEFDMATKTDSKTLDKAATGTIGPEGRDVAAEKLTGLYERLATDEFYVPVPQIGGKDVVIPCGCVDGRCGGHLVPNAAGGTETIVIADALTTERQRNAGQTVAEHVAAYAHFLIEAGLPVGGHGDTEHGPEGCGANKKLGAILQKIVDEKDALGEHMRALGVSVSDTLLGALSDKAAGLLDEHYASTAGTPVYEELKAAAGEESVPALRGTHGEVAVVINTKVGTTLDRDAVAAEFGEDIQAFNVDVWAVQNAAELNSFSQDETDAKFAAMVMYNLATAMVLAHSSLRIVVR